MDPVTTNEINQDEARLVYAGIQAVAAQCDGAMSDDGVGFNGQDTLFGKRIAAQPFDQWSPAIILEAARIASTYRKQIEARTGVDVSTLDLVKGTANNLTNRVARDEARGFDRVGLKANRKAERFPDGTIRMSWNSKDPDCFGVLLAEVKALPGRRWTGQFNEVAMSIEALDFIERHAVATNFDVDLVRSDLTTAVRVGVEAPAPAPKPLQVRLEGDVVRLSFPYDPAAVAAVRNLPGRKYHGDTKTNTVHLSHDVLRFAEQFNLTVDPAVVEALKGQEDAGAAEAKQERLLAQVSGSADPSALPGDFLAQVLAACPKARAV
jgi:hypothetical protein